MSAAWLWARRELRRRWRAVAVLAALTAIAGGVAMTAITGARRSLVVVAETMEERRQPDVLHFIAIPDFDWEPIVRLPYVESYGVFAATGLCIRETGGLGERIGEVDGALCDQPPVKGGIQRSIARMDILEGRMPTGPREVAVNRMAHERLGFDVGDRLHYEAVGPGRLDEYWAGEPRGARPWGPTFEVRVTGVFAGADDYWRVISGGRGFPGVALSRAFIPARGDEIEYREQAMLRLRGGEADIPRLTRDLARITGDPAFPIRNVREAQRRVERTTRVEATALLLFAIALLAAAAVLVGQALTRLVSTGADDAPVLRALGIAPGALVVALAAPGVVAGAAGAAGAVVVAVATSPRVPIGLARTFELHGGVRFDWPVLALGALGIVLAAGLASGAAAALALRRTVAPAAPPSHRRRRSIARLPLPAPAALGVRMALQRRAALAGAAFGVLAIVAALTVREGMVDAIAHPERGGHTWDAAYQPPVPERRLARDRDIVAAAEVSRATVNLGGLPAQGYGIRPVGRPLRQVILEGRRPERADEVVLGPSTAAALDARVGVRLPAGPNGARPVRVVGTALLWEEAGAAAYDQGVWATPAGLSRLDPTAIHWTVVFADLRPGTDPDALARRLGMNREPTWPREAPAGLDNLHTTRNLPALLGALLALLGSGAVGHGLVTTVRRRRRDVAILRALGMSSRQARATLAWQATTVAVLGLAVGVPVGLLEGRLAWEWIATAMPLQHVAPGAALALLLVVPGALLVVNAVALWPARTAVRTRPAAVLRAE